MSKKYLNILMIDDHPLILDRYIMVVKSLESLGAAHHFEIERAHSIEEATAVLETIYKIRELHLVFLDIGLPGDENELHNTGLDLGRAIRKSHPDAKIVVITGYNEFSLLHTILTSLKPAAVLLKSELNPEGLRVALQEVLDGGQYYTKTVNRLLTQPQTRAVLLDDYDLLILYHLAGGKRTNELSLYLPLSYRSIQRRKTKLKEVLKVAPECSDVELLNRAKKAGYL